MADYRGGRFDGYTQLMILALVLGLLAIYI
jgi:hypothetical protein